VNLAYGSPRAKTGPYTLTNLYQPPESTQLDASGHTYQVYSGKAHPEQTWSGKGANDCADHLRVERLGVQHPTDYVVQGLPQTDGSVKLKFLTSNGAAPAKLLDFTSTGDLSAITAMRVRFLGK
jgi:hypothetical protein